MRGTYRLPFVALIFGGLWRCIALARTTKRLIVAGAALVAVAVAVISFSDSGSDISDPQQLVERLRAAGIEGCRTDGERAVACTDVLGVAYFRGRLLDEEMPVADAVAFACDESTIAVLFVEGQSWIGQVRAHPDRGPDLAAALGSTQVACAATA